MFFWVANHNQHSAKAVYIINSWLARPKKRGLLREFNSTIQSMDFYYSFWMLRPPGFRKVMLTSHVISCKNLDRFGGSFFGQNNMGCLWQPLNLTLLLLHNITFLKPDDLNIQKLHLKSIDCVVLLNFQNPVPGQPTNSCLYGQHPVSTAEVWGGRLLFTQCSFKGLSRKPYGICPYGGGQNRLHHC